MKHTLTLYYSVQNGGDGSAYPRFMNSKELAEYDQENMTEGWGESCTGSITLESDSPIVSKNEITTPEHFFIDLVNNEEETQDFIKRFFPHGKPVFKIELENVNNQKENYPYVYNKVFANGVYIKKVFRNKNESGEIFEKLLNS